MRCGKALLIYVSLEFAGYPHLAATTSLVANAIGKFFARSAILETRAESLDAPRRSFAPSPRATRRAGKGRTGSGRPFGPRRSPPAACLARRPLRRPLAVVYEGRGIPSKRGRFDGDSLFRCSRRGFAREVEADVSVEHRARRRLLRCTLLGTPLPLPGSALRGGRVSKRRRRVPHLDAKTIRIASVPTEWLRRAAAPPSPRRRLQQRRLAPPQAVVGG